MRNYNFGKGKWVFVDWLGIEPGSGTHWDEKETAGYCVPYGLELKTHMPDVIPEFCIPLDKPWEQGSSAFYATFLKDGGIFRCWYELAGHRIGYAESDDGINWKKPSLGLQEIDGSKANNLLDCGAHGAGIFIDLSARPEERYKMVSCIWTDTERLLMGAISPDGLHWTSISEPLMRNQQADTQTICLYDEQKGKYVLYTRQSDGFMQRRGINRSESDDFRRFPPSQPVLESNPTDPPDWDFYCNGYSRWPQTSSAHLMRISMYKHTSDVVNVHLAVSRDGAIWHRPQGRQPWITGGLSYPGPYSSVYACSGILHTGAGEWSTYLGVSHHAHNEPIERNTQPAGILRARMREDGFMSLSSEGRGEAWTIPFTLECDTIRLNVNTQYAGFARAELLVSSGASTGGRRTSNQSIPGYSISDCMPISGNHIDAPLTWKYGPELGKFRGQTVRLHLELNKADLYSLKFDSKIARLEKTS
ncbi:MAG: hypothetical protein JW957_08665 [Candidatus Omnitrophica bacterium]|nr:hypothetical protein [Candidatus Omnitrophota bacterium]